MGSGNPNGNKPMLCPHGILGKTKCKRCKSDYQMKWQYKPENQKWIIAHRHSKKGKAQKRKHERIKSGIPAAIAAQEHKGKCPICGKHRTLVPDHDHKRKVFRAWICGVCNRALGFFEKSNAAKFILYLNNHKEKHGKSRPNTSKPQP